MRYSLPMDLRALPFAQRLFYGYIGRVNALAHAAANRRLLGVSLGGWLALLLVLALLGGLLRSWPAWLLLLLLGGLVWMLVSFRAARRANFNHFLPTADPPPGSGSRPPIPPYERVPLHATGVFSVTGRDADVLSRPGHYWQVPLGDHIVMVEETPGKFAYQFFDARSLQSVRRGLLLIGTTPTSCLALTFLSSWGPDYTKFQQYDDGLPSKTPPRPRTIYLSFADAETEQTVWHHITNG